MATTTNPIQKALLATDLAKLTPEERGAYVNEVCASLNLNPLTKPFAFLKNRNGDLVLYALKDCTEQLRTVHAISVQILAREVIEGVYVVTAKATRPDGRADESTGAVPIDGKKGDDRANAMMKAETKAKRRVTLSICGLGMLDESEVETIGGAKVEHVQNTPDWRMEHVQNTPAEQAELAQRRVQETRGDGPSQGAAQSPAAEGHPPTPTEAAPVIPGPLKALYDNIVSQKHGAVRQAFDFMKAQLREASPEYGETEYKRIVAKYDESHPGVKTAKVYWDCILALWETGESFRAAAREAVGGYQGTDADIPFEAEPEQAALLPEVVK